MTQTSDEVAGRLKVGPVALDLVKRICSAGLGLTVDDMLSVRYFPGRGAHLAIVVKPDAVSDGVLDAEVPPFVDRLWSEGPFVNLTLNSAIAELEFGEARALPMRCAIEHTSLVPVYPINLATFRSSVIGEWLRRSLMYQGADVRAHCWVQDSARQLGVVNRALRSSSRQVARGAIGKGDHTIGRIFVEQLLREDGRGSRDARRIATEMFPLGTSGIRRPAYGDWVQDVLLGWRATFNAVGVRVDHFDRDPDVLRGLDWRSALEVAREAKSGVALPRGKLAVEQLSYLEWCVLYYVYLLTDVDLALSVVSYRQLHVQHAARDFACAIAGRRITDLVVIPYGDVEVAGALDRIRAGAFHLVDDLSQFEERDPSCLVERFLMARAQSNLRLSLPVTSTEAYGGTGTVADLEPVAAGVLLLEELQRLLQMASLTGDFAPVVRWTGLASTVRTRLPSGFAPVSVGLGAAIDTFAPFPTRVAT